MASEIAVKMSILEKIIEERDMSGNAEGKTPLKFSFVKYFGDDGKERVKCKCTRALSQNDIVNTARTENIPKSGFSYEEWVRLTEALWDYLIED